MKIAKSFRFMAVVGFPFVIVGALIFHLFWLTWGIDLRLNTHLTDIPTTMAITSQATADGLLGVNKT